ncbi:IS66 family transposase [Rhodoblastus sp.]|uniref:IS66 family transposase n=1 Tax=Rhodoblastus sp. TaxID=1962975 RepID=UPI003F9D8470
MRSKGRLRKTDTDRLWIYVRPRRQAVRWRRAARGHLPLLARSSRRAPQAQLAGCSGILQADAYDGYNKLYLVGRKPGPIREAACWVHAWRPFFAMADIEENARRKAPGKREIPLSPIAVEVVRRAVSRPVVGRSHDLHARPGGEALARARPR